MNIDSAKLLEEAERLITRHFIEFGPLDEDEAIRLLRDATKHLILCADCGHPQDAHWADTDHCIYPLGEGTVCRCAGFKEASS